MASKKPTLYLWKTDPAGSKAKHTISWEQHVSNTLKTPSGAPPTGERTVNSFGQMITFAIEDGGDQRFTGYATVIVTKTNNTIAKIAKNRGHPNEARHICDLNGIKHPSSVLKLGRRIRVPDRLRASQRFHVLAGDSPPTVTGGYAKINVINRTERAGISVFTGYDPITIEVPVRFESEDLYGSWHGADGSKVERDIALLEQMAGRGNFSGAAIGAPPIVRVSVRDNDGAAVGLLPFNYQWTYGNQNAPIYWVSAIEWDTEALRNDRGERIRQLATITLTQYVTPDRLVPSAAERAKAAKPKPTSKK